MSEQGENTKADEDLLDELFGDSEKAADNMSEQEKKNRREYAEQIRHMEYLQQQMEIIFGKKANLSFDIAFHVSDQEKSNDKIPAVFLTKRITNASVQTVFTSAANGGKSEGKHIVTEYDGNIKLIHQQKKIRDKAIDVVTVDGFKLQDDIFSKEEKIIDNALLEIAQGAIMLVRYAKFAGVTSVNFGNTTNPLYRLALQYACAREDVDCRYEIPVGIAELPATIWPQEELANHLAGALKEASENIFSTPSYTDKSSLAPQPAAA